MITNPPGYRRTKRTAVAVVAAALAVVLLTDPGSAAPATTAAAADFNPGTGSATALGYKVNPTNGNLSFGITVGESIAGHQNTAATGQSRAINTGVIGVTLAGEACDGGDPTLAAEDQPQPVIVRTGDKGAEDGVSEFEQGIPSGIEKFARATDTPWAQAITTIAPLGDPATIFINGGRTISSSGIVNGNTREAIARTELGTVSLGGGAITLDGLTWEAVNRTGAVNEHFGTFTVGAIKLAGQPMTLPGDAFDQISALDAILTPLGFDITPPASRFAQGVAFVDPLVIAVVPSPQRDGLTLPILTALQPLREQIVDALIAQDCGNSTYITVADIALGSVTGAGALGLELGGVRATTADFERFQFGGIPLPTLPSVTPLPTLPLIPSIPGSPATVGGSDVEPTAPSGPDKSPAAPIVDVSGTRGGWLALIGGLGLVLLIATAEADRRKMQHALRVIPLEA